MTAKLKMFEELNLSRTDTSNIYLDILRIIE